MLQAIEMEATRQRTLAQQANKYLDQASASFGLAGAGAGPGEERRRGLTRQSCYLTR